MTKSNRNRASQKGNEKENRTGNNTKAKTGYRKLPDNKDATEDSVSTRGNSANGKYSKTNVRDEDIDNEDVRGEAEG